jgi:hypothetical protein
MPITISGDNPKVKGMIDKAQKNEGPIDISGHKVEQDGPYRAIKKPAPGTVSPRRETAQNFDPGV